MTHTALFGLFTATVLCSISSIGIHAQPTDARIKELLTLRVSADKRAIGLAAVVVQGSAVRIVTHGTLGLDRAAPVTADTLFEIGSVSKTFTSLLLADMVLKGEVKLDDAVEKWLPQPDDAALKSGARPLLLRDPTGAPIRLLDLATHRSGLPRMPDNMPRGDPQNPYVDFGEPQLLKFLASRAPARDSTKGRLPRKRDEAFEYSNLGFGLLGYVLARAANMPFAELLQKRVFTPLGLSSTYVDVPSSELERMSDGHAVDRSDKFQKAKHWTFGTLAPAGALVMSARDLGRYAQAACGAINTPLAAAFVFAQKRHAESAEPANPQGLAWVLATLNEHTVMSHRGLTGGFASALWVDPQTKTATAVLSNANATPDDIALHLLEPRIPPKGAAAAPATVREVKVAPATLKPYAGTYRLEPNFDVTIRLRDGKLFAQATGQSEFELFAKSDSTFFARITPLEVVFEDIKDGKAGRFQLMQAGSTRPAPRVE